MSDPAADRADGSRGAPFQDPRLAALASESGYTIHERIGSGGMGIVYRAHDADGAAVAIKLLRHDISGDPRARERLAREVAAQQRVRSDSIVKIFDAELDSPDAFVVTEYIPGPTLEEAATEHGGLHPEAVREIGLVLGETLQEIHAAGVIHRDLKPSNVMLRGAQAEDLIGYDPEGPGLDPVIIDFGIAMAAEESRLTSTGLVMGTASYLDPQVVRTNHSGKAGDWWALSAMLAFAATGRPPFGTGRADLVFLRAERGELDVEGVPTELAAWLRAALQAETADRPDPAEMLARLDELDLSIYDDPGETELLAAGTQALPAEAPGERTQVLPAGAPGERTELLGAAPAPTEALGIGPRGSADSTAVLPALASPGAATPARTEDATELIPVVAEPATQVLPPVPEPAPTQVMPIVRAAPGQPAPPLTGAVPAPSPYPQRSATPQPSPYPQPSPQPAPYAQQLAPQQIVPQPWQRPLAPRRSVLVWAGHAILIGLSAIAPYMALAMMLLLGASARTWERSHRALETRRARGSTGAGSSIAVGTAGPFRFLAGLLEIALQGIFPLVLGLLIGVAVDGAAALAGTTLPDGVLFATAFAITLLLVWVGLGSRTTRDGAHRMVDAAAPDRLWSAVVLGLLLLIGIAVGATILVRGGEVDYFPFGQWRLGDLLPWRG
ncbi:serine/threonine-protein kinase [Brachybacterium hainanense]|uniref:Protein kinase n=1 Tax=Brachybacterium hainanense TaxID=1541174 RepID=A0ABV6RDS5_9MICO